MPASATDIEKQVLIELYEGRSENPTAFQKFRGAEEFAEDDVAELFDDLMSRQLIRGNVEERNVQLTADGIEYIETNYPGVTDSPA